MKIKTWEEIHKIVLDLKSKKKKIVFTNGCFDILHAGHIQYLREAKRLADILILGLNSDESVKILKGKNRPINNQQDRALVLSELISVDYIVIFQEDTPYDLINYIKPDILVKGGDWNINEIIGSDVVLKSGGLVKSLSYKEGFSTSNLFKQIKDNF